MMKLKEAVKTAYISYEISKGKPPLDVQAFVFYCKNRRNIKKANWTVCQTVIEEETVRKSKEKFEASQVSNNYDDAQPQPQQQETFQQNDAVPTNGQSNVYMNNFQQPQPQQPQISASMLRYGRIQFCIFLSQYLLIQKYLKDRRFFTQIPSRNDMV